MAKWAEEYEAQPWLHVYPQAAYHSTLRITGTPNGLRAIIAACQQALDKGRGEAGAVTRDGEGYGIEVERTNTTGFKHVSLPYVDEFARDLKTSP